jgi:hypothetical protein
MNAGPTLRASLVAANVQAGCYYRVHLGHRENATNLAINLIKKAAQIEMQEVEASGDPLLKELCSIGEPWATHALLQGAYIREYHEWEKAVKNYIHAQHSLNGIQGFKWKPDGKSIVQRTIEYLAVFSVAVDQNIMDRIDAIRNKVNDIKHEPLEHEVDKSDYDAAISAFGAFWDKIMEHEGFMPPNAGNGPIPLDTPFSSEEFIEQFNKAMKNGDPQAIVEAFRKAKDSNEN